MKAYYDQARASHDWISDVAKRHNVDPNDVVPPLADFSPYEEVRRDPIKLTIDADISKSQPNQPYEFPNGWIGEWSGQGDPADRKTWKWTYGGPDQTPPPAATAGGGGNAAP
jgi:hypothetical protein